jgi:hypothetical protein
MTEAEIREEYPGIGREDIQACLLFATGALKDMDFMPCSGIAGPPASRKL